MMKKILCLSMMGFISCFHAQSGALVSTAASHTSTSKGEIPSQSADSIAAFIPIEKNGKFGFKDRKSKIVIAPMYSNVGFFTQDCQILNSPNQEVQKYGTAEYASVVFDKVTYKIDKQGNRVYKVNSADLGKCQLKYKPQKYACIVKAGMYGVFEKGKLKDPNDLAQYQIPPKYEFMHIMEGTDIKNPMIVAAKNNKFGVIDVHNNVIIPFEYADIKRNFSWKLGRLFEVTKDGKKYFYINEKNQAY